MRDACGLEAVLDADGQSFDDVAAERLAECEEATAA
jgi:hypothetical protein